MGNLKISQFNVGDPAEDGDLIPVDRSGVNYAVTAGSISDLYGGPTLGLTTPSWWGSFEGGLYYFNPTLAGLYGTTTGNQVKCSMVRIDRPITISKISTLVNANGGAGSLAGFGYYTTSGNKIFSWDSIDIHAGGIQQTTLVSPVTLQPGEYFAASACSNSSSAASQCGYQGGSTSEGIETWNVFGTKRSGTAANAMVAGAMPATLGVISVGGGGFTVLPHFFMEP
jgi:hypothetical protein